MNSFYSRELMNEYENNYQQPFICYPEDELNSQNQFDIGETNLNDIFDVQKEIYNQDDMNKTYLDNTNYYSNIYFNQTDIKEESCNFNKNELNELKNIRDNDKEEKINFLNKKVNREKETITNVKKKKDIYTIKKGYQSNLNNERNNKKKSIELDLEEDNKKVENKFGRKNKNDIKNRKHNQFCDDNIINKIKGYFFNGFVRDFIKKHSINEIVEFKKLPNKFISDLTKEKNEKLYKMKISDILYEEEISTKYSTFNRDENKKIIDKIYEEKKEIYIIKILELTFEELFIIFRRKLEYKEDTEKLEKIKDKIEELDLNENNNNYKDVQLLFKDIEDKYKKKLGDKELNEYIDIMKNLCLGYENWFKKKIGRISIKNNQ